MTVLDADDDFDENIGGSLTLYFSGVDPLSTLSFPEYLKQRQVILAREERPLRSDLLGLSYRESCLATSLGSAAISISITMVIVITILIIYRRNSKGQSLSFK